MKAPAPFSLLRCCTVLLLAWPLSGLTQQGADQINIHGQLVMAARAGQVARVQGLLRDGANVNARDRNGDTPLNMAAAKGQTALAQALLQAGADVNLANLAGVTPLMGAAFNVKPELFTALLAAGAQPAPLDRVKKNAATYAAAQGCTACLQALRQAGVDLNAQSEDGLTLLMWAGAYGQTEAVRDLLQHGAQRAAQDNRGKTAHDLARESQHPALLPLLAP